MLRSCVQISLCETYINRHRFSFFTVSTTLFCRLIGFAKCHSGWFNYQDFSFKNEDLLWPASLSSQDYCQCVVSYLIIRADRENLAPFSQRKLDMLLCPLAKGCFLLVSSHKVGGESSISPWGREQLWPYRLYLKTLWLFWLYTVCPCIEAYVIFLWNTFQRHTYLYT